MEKGHHHRKKSANGRKKGKYAHFVFAFERRLLIKSETKTNNQIAKLNSFYETKRLVKEIMYLLFREVSNRCLSKR